MINGLIDISDQFLLPFSVWKWKGKCLNRIRSCFLPCKLKICPLLVFKHQLFKPVSKLYKRIIFMKILCFFCFQITIGHSDTNMPQMTLLSINIGIALRLCQMNCNRLLNPSKFFIRSFDFVNQNLLLIIHRRKHLLFFFLFRFLGRLLSHKSVTFRNMPLPVKINNTVCSSFHDNIVVFGAPCIL